MSDISASAVASLRARTGVSILACKSALEEAGGDEEKAIEILRSKGAAQAVKKAEREQKEGYIFCASDGKKAALVVLHCETDFVSRGDQFQALGQELAELALKEGKESVEGATEKITEAVQQLGENISVGDVYSIEGSVLGIYVHTNGKIGTVVSLESGDAEVAKDIAMHAAAMNPLYTTPDEVPGDVIEKEKSLWKEQLASEGKPAEILEKILEGKEKKFREENALVKQDFVKNPEQTIEQLLDGASITEYVRVDIS